MKNSTTTIIQHVANELFQKFGFEKTSIDDIARKAHKAKRTIYNHFNSKEELFCLSVKNEINDIRTKLQQVVDVKSPWVLPQLREYLLLRVDLFAQAKTIRVALKDNMFKKEDYRFEELHAIYHNFSAWEHDIFKKVWYAKPSTEAQSIIENQAHAFADMLQVTLNGLFHSFFVEDNYERYKSSYELLIHIIVNSVFETFQNNTFNYSTTNNL